MKGIITAARIVGSARTIKRGVGEAASSARTAARRFYPRSPILDAPREEQIAYWRHRLKTEMRFSNNRLTVEEAAEFIVSELDCLLRR